MVRRKECRDLTVGEMYRGKKRVPVLRLSGLWLAEAGFSSGDFVSVKCEDGKLVITLNEEKAKAVEAENASMEEEIKKIREKYRNARSNGKVARVAEEMEEYGL